MKELAKFFRIFLGASRGKKGGRRLLAYAQMPQDFDLLYPILLAVRERGIASEILFTSELVRSSPRAVNAAEAAGFPYLTVPKHAIRSGALPSLRQVGALLTASESTAGPHRIAYELALRANRKGIPTFTVQHGFDNIGLTYFDAEYPTEKIDFASRHILIWGDLATLDPQVRPGVKERCVPCGYFKTRYPYERELPPFKKQTPYLVALFENLHWSRYSDEYRRRFVQDLAELPARFPEVTFLVKPHHAGKWLTPELASRLTAPNFIYADPNAPEWEPFTAPALIRHADAVITTPSTVALDACWESKPVAVVSYDLPLPRYAPLPLLRGGEDWARFINGVMAREASPEGNVRDTIARFRQRWILPGEGDRRVADTIESFLRGRA